jgi:ribonuclease III
VDISQLMNKIDYQFKDIEWLHRALIHRSYSSGTNNERLEFLGDSVLSTVISQELFLRDREIKEGRLSRMRAALVNGDILAELGESLGLHYYIRLGTGELKSGGRYRKSIIADAFEALIGAIYIDSGILEAQKFVLSQYTEKLKTVADLTLQKDPKSTLQEWAQEKKFSLPEYVFTVEGLAHDQVFTVVCIIAECSFRSEGVGSSRRKAERQAAKNFLEKINEE